MSSPRSHSWRVLDSTLNPSVLGSKDCTNNHYPCWRKILETTKYLKRIAQETMVWRCTLHSQGRQCPQNWSWMNEGLAIRQKALSRANGMMYCSLCEQFARSPLRWGRRGVWGSGDWWPSTSRINADTRCFCSTAERIRNFTGGISRSL